MIPPAVVTVDHVTVTAPPALEGAVIDFYSEVLGLERLNKPAGTRRPGAWFQAGDVQVHITVEAEPSERPGHFGVMVDDYESAVRRLRAVGCSIEPAGLIPGRDRCYTRDPAGNTIEIVCYRDEPHA